jgi:phospholipase C
VTLSRRVRRALLALLPIAAVLAGPNANANADASAGVPRAEDSPTATPIKHFVTLMQENHSFDNYFGTYPGADGPPPGACMPNSAKDPAQGCSTPFSISGKPVLDLGHSVDIYRKEFNGGKMDGFVSAFEGQAGFGNLAMGYYDDKDIPYYWNLADNYVLFDRFFTSAAGGSVWNHMFWVTGAPGNPKSDALLPGGFDHVPTIFDALQKAGVSWKFYIQNYDPSITFRNPGNGDRGAQIVWAPVLNYNRFLDDPELNQHIVSLDQYYDDLANGTLPAVSYIVPSGASEHPPGSIQAGERFVRTLVSSLQRSSAWDSSAFMWTYDDWGGWYDHVTPPQIDQYGYGFRAPALLVSSYAKHGHIDSTQLDFTGMLKFIETNWGLAPLADRDAQSNNILTAFDFDAGPRPPALLDRVRDPIPPPKPKQAIVYASYSLAIAVPIGLIVIGYTRSRRRQTSRGAT